MNFSGVYDQEHVFNDLFATIADYCDLELEEALQLCLDKMRQFLATLHTRSGSTMPRQRIPPKTLSVSQR